MNTKHKIITIETLKKRLVRLRKEGFRIAFTNGCFDILHFGHVDYLQTAKKPKHILVVGLNSDASVHKIKGPKRPIISQKDRAAVLAALACVDFVVLFSQETPLKLIRAVKPDVLIKGADWKGKGIVGSEEVLKRGGKVEYVNYIKGYSSTDIIETIKKKC